MTRLLGTGCRPRRRLRHVAGMVALGALWLAACSGADPQIVTSSGTGAAETPMVEGTEPGPGSSPTDDATSGHPSASTRRLFDEVPPLHPSVDDYARGEVILRGPDAAWALPVLVARTSAERQHGLMEVREIPDGTGMVFLFEEDRSGGFWMFGTHVDIDIIYFDAAGQPVDWLTMPPCAEQPCPTYPPSGPYRHTLEVAGDFLATIGFGADWSIEVAV